MRLFGLALLTSWMTGAPLFGEDPEAPMELKLVTFNIRFPSDGDQDNLWPHRKGLLFETVREMSPDVMGVQEAFASQLEEIVEAVEGYAYVGVGRDDGKSDGEHAAIFYKTKRFSLEKSGTFWLSDTPDVVASNTWDAACNRVCTWVRLKDRESGEELAVHNAHFDHRSVKARENSPRMIVEQMVAKGHGELPLILMGDFNSYPDSPQMAYLLEGEARLEGRERKSPLVFHNTLPHEEAMKSATYHGWKGRVEGRQIDYVLVANNGWAFDVRSVAVNRSSRGERYPSDHYPVEAEVVFAGKPEADAEAGSR